MEKKKSTTKRISKQRRTYPRPAWVSHTGSSEEELCPDCFKVVGERSRYSLVCMLGKIKKGMTVNELTERMKLQQPTVTHHLHVLQSVGAVEGTPDGRRRIYTLNRNAHCFEECKIPY